MIELLILLVFNSFYCIGLHAATRWIEIDSSTWKEIGSVYMSRISGKLLYKLSYITRNWPDWKRDPLTECPTCMASIHSIYFFFPFGAMNFPIEYALLWPVYAITLSGLNTWLNSGTHY